MKRQNPSEGKSSKSNKKIFDKSGGENDSSDDEINSSEEEQRPLDKNTFKTECIKNKMNSPEENAVPPYKINFPHYENTLIKEDYENGGRDINGVLYIKSIDKIMVVFKNQVCLYKSSSPYEKENTFKIKLEVTPKAFLEDSHNKLWLGYYKSITVYDPKNFQTETHIYSPSIYDWDYVKEVLQIEELTKGKILVVCKSVILFYDEYYIEQGRIRDNGRNFNDVIVLNEKSIVASTGEESRKLIKIEFSEGRWNKTAEMDDEECEVFLYNCEKESIKYLFKKEDKLIWLTEDTNNNQLWIRQINIQDFKLMSKVKIDLSSYEDLYAAFPFLYNNYLLFFYGDSAFILSLNCKYYKKIKLPFLMDMLLGLKQIKDGRFLFYYLPQESENNYVSFFEIEEERENEEA